ncbi:hypothetical protein B0H17DRAFT_1068945 [Mycena rosella]|uniref:Uncharacterized protein n=1 Tax=Mycena rosella TaxID=1033263 RepID=A0AAD7GHI4_MYCRO|nr:hypothetical protein B0H17DRAFT_1068945 [Mycena rosella]
MAVAPGTKETYIGAFLENIIYGLYLSVFFECCALLWRKKLHGAKSMYLMVTTALMFILITARCIIDTYRCVIAFDNPDVDFGPPNSTLGLITNACWALVTPVADIFIVFRTFIVWNRNWYIVILPMLLCLANFGIGILVILSLVEVGDQNSAISSSKVDSLNAFISLSLCTNVVCTGLIAFKIIQVYRQVAWMVSNNAGRADSMRILSIIVESAAIYTLLLIATLITDHVASFVTFILIDCTPPTIGLVFSYIIIRVSRGTSYGESTEQGTISSIRAHRPTDRTFESGPSLSSRSGAKSEVQIRLERTARGQSGTEMDSASRDDELNASKYASA